jgi:hypothetical protein
MVRSATSPPAVGLPLAVLCVEAIAGERHGRGAGPLLPWTITRAAASVTGR